MNFVEFPTVKFIFNNKITNKTTRMQTNNTTYGVSFLGKRKRELGKDDGKFEPPRKIRKVTTTEAEWEMLNVLSGQSSMNESIKEGEQEIIESSDDDTTIVYDEHGYEIDLNDPEDNEIGEPDEYSSVDRITDGINDLLDEQSEEGVNVSRILKLREQWSAIKPTLKRTKDCDLFELDCDCHIPKEVSEEGTKEKPILVFDSDDVHDCCGS